MTRRGYWLLALFLKGARLAGSKFDGPWGAHQAAADGQIEILRSLLQAEAGNLNSVDDCGMTPLLWTTRNEACRHLASRRAVLRARLPVRSAGDGRPVARRVAESGPGPSG